MKNLYVCILAGAQLSAPAWANDNAARVEASRNAVKELQGALLTELQAAMKTGGPVNAIEVCHKRAAEIAAGISTKHGWKVGRTSLKHRNPGNAPDAWEKQVLQDFEKRKMGTGAYGGSSLPVDDGVITGSFDQLLIDGTLKADEHPNIALDLDIPVNRTTAIYPLDPGSGQQPGPQETCFLAGSWNVSFRANRSSPQGNPI